MKNTRFEKLFVEVSGPPCSSHFFGFGEGDREATNTWVEPCTIVTSFSLVDGLLRHCFLKIFFWHFKMLIDPKALMSECVQRCTYTMDPLLFVQTASMGLRTTLLVVFAGMFATAGNDVRLYIDLLVYFDSPLADVQTTGLRPWLLLVWPGRCHINVYFCRGQISLHLNIRACLYIRTCPYRISMYAGLVQAITTAKSG